MMVNEISYKGEIMQNRILVTLAVVLSVILAACGGDADSGGGDSAAIDLSQTATTEEPISGGTLSANYPEGWFSEAAGGAILLADSEAALASQADGAEEGQVLTSISFLSNDMVSALAGDGELTALTVLDAMSGQAGDEVEMGEPEAITVGGNSAALVNATDDTSDTMVIMVETEGGFVLVATTTALGEMASARPTIEAIAGSVTYTPAE